MTRARRTAVVVAVLLALQAIAIIAYLRVDRSRRAARPFVSTPLAGLPAPALVAERPDGASLDASRPSGRTRLVHFWATWCEPCRVELPGLLARAREVAGLELVAVSVDADWAAVHAFFPDGIPPEVVRAVDRDAHHRYGATALPDSYVLDRDGRLVERIAGTRDWSTARAGAYLSAVVAR